MWLTREELQELTDLRRPGAIKRWLASHNYPFEIAASGWPKVLRSLVESRQGATAQPKKDRPRLHLA